MARPVMLCLAFAALAGPAFAAPADEAEKGLRAQVEAWNRDDLEGALGRYWNSPDLVWVNRRGLDRGFADFAQGMRAEAKVNPDLGDYHAEILEARELSADSALLVVRWSITRDGKRLMGGVSTQVWRPVEGRWVIVLEHAS